MHFDLRYLASASEPTAAANFPAFQEGWNSYRGCYSAAPRTEADGVWRDPSSAASVAETLEQRAAERVGEAREAFVAGFGFAQRYVRRNGNCPMSNQ